MIITSGLVLSADGYSIENMWASYWYTTEEEGLEQVWIWNPQEHEITHVDPEEEMIITHIGSWDVVSEPDGYTTLDYIIEGETSKVVAGTTLPVLISLDDQIIDTQERVDLLEHELATQIMRTVSLEKKLTDLQLEMVELKNKPNT